LSGRNYSLDRRCIRCSAVSITYFESWLARAYCPVPTRFNFFYEGDMPPPRRDKHDEGPKVVLPSAGANPNAKRKRIKIVTVHGLRVTNV